MLKRTKSNLNNHTIFVILFDLNEHPRKMLQVAILDLKLSNLTEPYGTLRIEKEANHSISSNEWSFVRLKNRQKPFSF